MFIRDAGYGLEMITTIGYVAGSDNQASLKVNSAAGFLGAVARVLCGAAGAARKLFSLKAFRAARLKTPAAAMLMVAASMSRSQRRRNGRVCLAQARFQQLKPADFLVGDDAR